MLQFLVTTSVFVRVQIANIYNYSHPDRGLLCTYNGDFNDNFGRFGPILRTYLGVNGNRGYTNYILSIYLSIYRIYIEPLQGNYSEALPAQARAKGKVLRRL